ncbi:MAG: hypothetical protein AAGF30_00380 [Pseudomonadota bacterium]
MSLITLTDPPAVHAHLDMFLRQHLRLSPQENDQDHAINSYFAAALEMVETYTRRRLLTQQLELRLNGFCGSQEIDLEVAPVQSVEAVEYQGQDGVQHTVPGDFYRVLKSEAAYRLAPVFGQIWPVTAWEKDVVRVRFVAGYGGVNDLPKAIYGALLMLTEHQFQHRDGSTAIEGNAQIETRLKPYRIWV